MTGWIRELLGPEADALLKYECKGIPRQSLNLPSPDHVDRIFIPSDRNQRVINNLARMHITGRLAGTGYMSILPVDRGSSIPPPLPSRPTRFTSTPKTSSSWPSRVVAMQSRPRSGC